MSVPMKQGVRGEGLGVRKTQTPCSYSRPLRPHPYPLSPIPCFEALEQRRLLSGSAGGFHILLEKGPDLAANTQASQAFDEAAAFLEAVFSDSISVVVDAELRALDPWIIGYTQSVQVNYGYNALRALMVADAGADESIAGALPTFQQLQYTVPNGFSVVGAQATRANLLALGVPAASLQNGPDSQYDPSVKRDMSIVFNSSYPFDYTRADGIEAGQVDFVGQAIHELAHGLGFESEVGTVDWMLDAGQSGGDVRMLPLDFFRLAPGAGQADFTDSPRILSPGSYVADQVLYDGGVYDSGAIQGMAGLTRGDIPMSTGAYLGDGGQPNHWKDQQITGVYIGVMNPTASDSAIQDWTSADARALGLIGWDVADRGTIAGQAFHDINSDGVKDAGDGGLPGWRVYLDTNNDRAWQLTERSAVTDANGLYEFAGLMPGTYTVREVLQPGWARTAPAGRFYTATLGYGQTIGDTDFGSVQLGSIAGRVFVDVNGNGIMDPLEPGRAGCQLYLDLDQDGLMTSPAERSVMTDAAGRYLFTDVKPGSYVIRPLAQSGWLLTAPDVGSRTATLGSGQNVGGQRFGSSQAAAIQGRLFNDLNGDGLKQPGELGLGGWDIYLDLNNDGSFDSQTEPGVLTSVGGLYRFDNLRPGSYIVRQVTESGWLSTVPLLGSRLANVSSGQVLAAQRLGNAQPAIIRGRVFNDLDGNGVKGVDEPLLADRGVYWDQNNNGALDGNIAVFTSDAAEELPADQTTSASLTVSGLSGVVQRVSVTLDITHPVDQDLRVSLISPSGTTVELFDAVGEIGQNFTGTVLDDAAAVFIADGAAPFTGSFRPSGRLADLATQSPNGDWQLAVVNRSGAAVGMLNSWSLSIQYGETVVRTGGDGTYVLNGLKPGTYVLRQVLPEGWHQSWPSLSGKVVSLLGGQVQKGKSFGTLIDLAT